MPLTAGAHLGPYEILGAIGAGGMGEVYRARDTKLGRDVAIKILPDAFAVDAERLARFKREAQVLASLNHPNIGAIYGFEDGDGVHALVLELVDGPTLADRIAQGPMPIDEALPIAKQVAEALESAHEQGIIHRDLKPANIKIRPDGTVKVLDFGLAKLAEPAAVAGTSMLTQSPTITTPAMTAAGMILGTAAYMSPEQAKGQPADKRSDIWAFGCVLYEMLTGRRAFDGEDVSDTLAAILRAEPAWNTLPRELPTNVRTLLTGCLQKARMARFADVAVVQFLLNAPASAPSSKDGRSTGITSLVIAAGIGALAVFAIGLGVRPSIGPAPAIRLSAAAPPGTSLNVPELGIAVSPDGTRVVFRAGLSAATSQLYLRETDRFDAVPLRGTPNPQSPFFSPDGQWIAFSSLGMLKKVAVTGGAPQDICAAPAVTRGGTWGSDDTIVFSTSANPGLMRVPASGGTPTVLVAPPANKGTIYRYPSFLPDGNAVVFTIFQPGSGGWDNADVAVVSLDGGDVHVVFHGGTRPRFASSGHLLVERAGAIFAVPFDPKGFRTSGQPTLAVDHVLSNPATGVGQYDVSNNGLLAYVPGSPDVPIRNPTWVTRQGNASTVDLQKPIVDLALSPDSRRAAFAIAGESTKLFVYNFETRTMPRLTTGAGADTSPRWTHDGQRIAYSATRNGLSEIYWTASDGSGGDDPLARADASGSGQFPRSFSPDGRFLIFQRGQGAASNDLWVLSPSEKTSARAFIDSPANETQAQFSPDGRWVAYQSNETDRDEIYIAPFPGPGAHVPVSTDGGQQPLWRNDGRELFYRFGDRVMAVDINLGHPPRIGTPHMLFQGQYDRAYDVTPDGQRFLLLKGEPQSQPTVLNIIVNWTQELKQRVPVK
jgi:serine/threonine-protein kinase